MAETDWATDAERLTRRAFEIAAHDSSNVVRADTSIGGGSTERAIAFGLVAALLEDLENSDVILGASDADVDPELRRLREENADLRARLGEAVVEVNDDELEADNDELRLEVFGDPDADVPEPGLPPVDTTDEAALEEAFGDPDAEVPEAGLPPLDDNPPAEADEAPAEPVAEAVDPEDYTKDQLIEMAKEQGVSTDGTKAEIAARLTAPMV